MKRQAQTTQSVVLESLPKYGANRSLLNLALTGIGVLPSLFVVAQAEDTVPQIQLRQPQASQAEPVVANRLRFEDLNDVALIPENSRLAEHSIGHVDGDYQNVAELELRIERDGVPADGQSGVLLSIKALDAQGALTGDVTVTVESSVGRLKHPDRLDILDTSLIVSGKQVRLHNGEGQILLLAPDKPADAMIRVSANGVVVQGQMRFVPEIRPLIVVGLAEGQVRGHRYSSNSALTNRPDDGFDVGLDNLSRNRTNGNRSTNVAGRVAVYAKGALGNTNNLLTLSYDSEKAAKGRLFRDLRETDFYPVYGDASQQAFDAQSSGRLYARIDHDQSFLLYGDFTTGGLSPAQQYGNYSRSLTGLQAQYESDRLQVRGFVARDSQKQQVKEILANDLSGPYDFGTNGIYNSEKLELILRDKITQAILPQQTQLLVRGQDYDFEVGTGRLILKTSQAATDSNGNNYYLRMNYEVDQGGDNFVVAGAEARVKVLPWWQVGATLAHDGNPLGDYHLYSVNSTIKLGDRTSFVTEFATSKQGATFDAIGNQTNPEKIWGKAARAELTYDGDRTQAHAYIRETSPAFNNANSIQTQGGGREIGGKLSYQLNTAFSFSVDASQVQSKDLTPAAAIVSTDRRASLTGRYQVNSKLSFDLGAEYTQPTAGASQTNAHTRANYQMSPRLGSFAEFKRAFNDNAYSYAAGGDYRFSDFGRLYVKHEYNNGILALDSVATAGTNNSLNTQKGIHNTIVGIDTSYMKDGQLFNEYRLRDGASGQTVQGALGLRNLWTLATGLKLNTTLERTQNVYGTVSKDKNETGTGVGIGIDYTANPLWKAGGRIEWRRQSTSSNWLYTANLAAKINRDWTFLEKSVGNREINHSTQTTRTENRLQLGVAYRPVDTNKMNWLTKYEFRSLQDATDTTGSLRSHSFSSHADYHPTRNWTYSGQVAAKWQNNHFGSSGNNVKDTFKGGLLAGRILYDVTEKWDVGVIGSYMRSNQASTNRFGVGVETGYRVMENMWLSVGYNHVKYNDGGIDSDYTAKGVYFKIRFKFDQNTFKSNDWKVNKSITPPEGYSRGEVLDTQIDGAH